MATAQAAPEGVHEPVLQIVNSTALRVVWDPPDTPNGIIAVYVVNFVGGKHDSTYNTSDLSIIIDGRCNLYCLHAFNSGHLSRKIIIKLLLIK